LAAAVVCWFAAVVCVLDLEAIGFVCVIWPVQVLIFIRAAAALRRSVWLQHRLAMFLAGVLSGIYVLLPLLVALILALAR
jgi:hypothetical protein